MWKQLLGLACVLMLFAGCSLTEAARQTQEAAEKARIALETGQAKVEEAKGLLDSARKLHEQFGNDQTQAALDAAQTAVNNAEQALPVLISTAEAAEAAAIAAQNKTNWRGIIGAIIGTIVTTVVPGGIALANATSSKRRWELAAEMATSCAEDLKTIGVRNAPADTHQALDKHRALQAASKTRDMINAKRAKKT